MTVRLLMIGDVVGSGAVDFLGQQLPELRRQRQVDFCVANVENAADGSGFTPEIVEALAKSGVDAFTGGDHLYSNKRIFRSLGKDARILRPANLSPLAKGADLGLFETPSGVPVAVASLLGREYMKPVDCPFRTAEALLRRIPPRTTLRVIDFHAEATAEKVAMGRHLDGRVSAVIGTHTHVPTADACILPGGTAYITDVGMTGPHDSVIGRRVERVVHFLRTQMPVPFDVATGDVRINGALVSVEAATGKAERIERVEIREGSPS